MCQFVRKKESQEVLKGPSYNSVHIDQKNHSYFLSSSLSVAGDIVRMQRSSDLGGFLMFSALKGASAGNSWRFQATTQADTRYCKYISIIVFQFAKVVRTLLFSTHFHSCYLLLYRDAIFLASLFSACERLPPPPPPPPPPWF